MNIEELYIDSWISKIDHSFIDKTKKIRVLKVKSIKKSKNPNYAVINDRYNIVLSITKVITEEEAFIITGIKKYKKELINKWIKKKNNNLFGTRDNIKPVLFIQDIKPSYDPLKIIVNDLYTIDVLSIDILSEEEALNIIKFYDSCIISESRIMPIEESCFVKATGLPKQKIPEGSVKKILYEMRMKNPEKEYEGYNCKFCGSFHIGSTSHLEKT